MKIYQSNFIVLIYKYPYNFPFNMSRPIDRWYEVFKHLVSQYLVRS